VHRHGATIHANLLCASSASSASPR
jgi:hypothetical protein